MRIDLLTTSRNSSRRLLRRESSQRIGKTRLRWTRTARCRRIFLINFQGEMAESENALIKASDAEPECQQLLQDCRYVAPMAGLLRFSRPLNCLMSAVGVGIGGVVGDRK